jgi:hypothetical protein
MSSQDTIAEMPQTQDTGTETPETQDHLVEELVETLETYATNIRSGFRDNYSLFYSYEHLPLSTATSFRLLTVWGSKNMSDPIICEIREHLLDDLPLYSALSYTWGGQARDREMIVVDKLGDEGSLVKISKFPVTETCEDALREMRGHRAIDTFTIWVDSICINQMDMLEREAQVSMMDRIYSQATQVNIWLGRGTPQSDRFFQVLETLLPIWEKRKEVTGQYFMCEDPVMTEIIDLAPDFSQTF